VRGADRRRWRMRVDSDHVLTFRADAVVAATPIPRASGPAGRRRWRARPMLSLRASGCPSNERRSRRPGGSRPGAKISWWHHPCSPGLRSPRLARQIHTSPPLVAGARQEIKAS